MTGSWTGPLSEGKGPDALTPNTVELISITRVPRAMGGARGVGEDLAGRLGSTAGWE